MLAFDKCIREMCSEIKMSRIVTWKIGPERNPVVRLRTKNDMELIEIRSVCAPMRDSYKAIRPTEELNQLIYLICLRSVFPVFGPVSAAQKGASKSDKTEREEREERIQSN